MPILVCVYICVLVLRTEREKVKERVKVAHLTWPLQLSLPLRKLLKRNMHQWDRWSGDDDDERRSWPPWQPRDTWRPRRTKNQRQSSYLELRPLFQQKQRKKEKRDSVWQIVGWNLAVKGEKSMWMQLR